MAASFICVVLMISLSISAVSALSMKIQRNENLKMPVAEGPKGAPALLQRKDFFSHVTNFCLFTTASTSIPGVAYGAAPIAPKDTDSLGAMARRQFRQKPPKVLRRKLSMDFAVLLMRSSYSALDKLDCVAMVSS